MSQDQEFVLQTTLEPNFRACGSRDESLTFSPERLCAHGTKAVMVEHYGLLLLPEIHLTDLGAKWSWASPTAWMGGWEDYTRHKERGGGGSQAIHPNLLPPAWWMTMLSYDYQFVAHLKPYGEQVQQATAAEDWPTVCQLLVEWSLAVNMLKGGWDVSGFEQCTEEQRRWLGRHLLRFRVVGTPFYNYAEGESIHDYLSGFLKQRDIPKSCMVASLFKQTGSANHRAKLCDFGPRWHLGTAAPRRCPNYSDTKHPDRGITALHIVSDYQSTDCFAMDMFKKFPCLQWIAYDCENMETGCGWAWTEEEVGADTVRQWEVERRLQIEQANKCRRFMKSPQCPQYTPPPSVPSEDYTVRRERHRQSCHDYKVAVDAALAAVGLQRPPDCHPSPSDHCPCQHRPLLHPRWRAFADGSVARHLCQRADLPESYFFDNPREHYWYECDECRLQR